MEELKKTEKDSFFNKLSVSICHDTAIERMESMNDQNKAEGE